MTPILRDSDIERSFRALLWIRTMKIRTRKRRAIIMPRMQMYKWFRGSLVVLTICTCALAQTYGGGGGGGMGGGTYTSPSHGYGHGAAIGAAVAAGAGATALYFGLRHHHRQVVGCVSPDGKTLATDDGKHTYQLAGTEQVNAGEHVSIVGKK